MRKRKLRTKSFLEYIEEGALFGHTPFTTVLPVMSWVPTTDSCAYSDLDKIRELRNRLIHAVSSPDIPGLPESELDKEHLYERSMCRSGWHPVSIDRKSHV